jgi:predicted dehydrogenase
MEKVVRWGVLSTAKIAVKTGIPAIQKAAFCEVAAIASRDLERARVSATALGVPTAYGSYEELICDPTIDVIYNALPNHLHAEWSVRALQAGKHVLCEKPAGLNAKEVGAVAAVSKRLGLVAAEAFMVRHHPQWKRTRELIAAGRIGEVRAVHTVFSYFLTDPDNVRNRLDIGGGGLYDVGCYAINTARYVFSAEPERAIAMFDRDPALGIDRMASGLLEFSGGRHLAFTCATQLSPCQAIRILGTKGRIELQVPFNAPADQPARIVIDDGRDLLGGGAEAIELDTVDQFQLQAEAFREAVLGLSPLESDLGDAVANMRVIDALFRSGQSQRFEQP